MSSRAITPTLQHPDVVIDASVWVSSLLPADTNHVVSIDWLRQYTGDGGLLVAPSLFVVEIAAALIRATSQAPLARQAVTRALSYGQLQLAELDSYLIYDSANAAINFQLKTGDAVYAALALQRGIPLVSWNRQQLGRASTQITTYRPDNFPF